MQNAKLVRQRKPRCQRQFPDTTQHEAYSSSPTTKQFHLPEEIVLLIVRFSVEDLNDVKLGKSPRQDAKRVFRNPFLRVDHACRSQVLQTMQYENLWIMLRGDSKKLREELLDDLRLELPVFPESMLHAVSSSMPIVYFKPDDGKANAYRTRINNEKRYSILFPFNMQSYLILVDSLASGARASKISIHIPPMSFRMRRLVQIEMIPALLNTIYCFEIAQDKICLDESGIVLSAEEGCDAGTRYVAQQIRLAALNIQSLREEGLFEESMLYALYIGARMVDIISRNLQWFTCIVNWATQYLSRPDWSSYPENLLRMEVLLHLHNITMLAAKWIDLHADDLRYDEFHDMVSWHNIARLFCNNWTLGWFGLSHYQRARQSCALSSFSLFGADGSERRYFAQSGVIRMSWLKSIASRLSIAVDMLGQDDQHVERVRTRLDELLQHCKSSTTAETLLKSKVPGAHQVDYTTIDGETRTWFGDADHVAQMNSAGGNAFPYLERAEEIARQVIRSGDVIGFEN